MILKNKIIAFFLLFTFVHVSGFTIDTIQKNFESQKDSIVLTVFNLENFYVVENTLSINNKYVDVIDNKITASKNIVFYQNPQIKIKIDNTILVVAKKMKVKSKFLSSTTNLSQKPKQATNYLPFGSFPDENSLFASHLHNNVLVPSKPRFILNAKSALNSFNKKTKYISLIKKVFFSSEKRFVSSFYSKTSRIRPPPAV
jgi:protoporphyrinogen oxidase